MTLYSSEFEWSVLTVSTDRALEGGPATVTPVAIILLMTRTIVQTGV